MPSLVTFTINGRKITMPEGVSILEAARSENIFIPSLCYHKSVDPAGICRLCIVEISGSVKKSVQASCVQKIKEGMVVQTETERINKTRQLILERLLERAPEAEAIVSLAARYEVTKTSFVSEQTNNCVLCGLCVRICRDKIGARALFFVNKGAKKKLSTDFQRFAERCIGCGACIHVCPTGALHMEDKGGFRSIFLGKEVMARFRLEKCEHCDKPFAPKRYLDLINKKAYIPKGLEFVDYICPDCFHHNGRISDKRKTMALRKAVSKWSVPRG